MAFATIIFPTTFFLFYPLQLFHVETTNSNDTKKNRGFHRFYGFLLNGAALSIHRSPLFQQNVLGTCIVLILWLYLSIPL
jgi:hypothetical protein